MTETNHQKNSRHHQQAKHHARRHPARAGALQNKSENRASENNKKKHTGKTVIGLVERFDVGEYERVEQILADVRELGVTHLRTDISWADWHSPHGAAWYKWLLSRLASAAEVLPYVAYTPSGDPQAYVDFIDHLIETLGDTFSAIELWNQPNSRAEWNRTQDNGWQGFAEMIGSAARGAKQHGKRTVLGGINPLDPGWLRGLLQQGALEAIDIVGIHGFPDGRAAAWDGWDAAVARVQSVLDEFGSPARIWLTETGFSTFQHDELAQMRHFLAAQRAPVDRVYWYGWQDLAPRLPAHSDFHQDERDLHLGIKRADGSPKLLYRIWASEGVQGAAQLAAMQAQAAPEPFTLPTPALKQQAYALVVGGAGFIGSNLARRLLEEGNRVLVFDALTRPGVEQNLRWLQEQYPGQLLIQIGDIRNPFAVEDAVRRATRVYHLAAQVAVTTSIDNPVNDFSVNAQGTLNLLEALRKRCKRIPFLFTSTNKVYGDLADVPLAQDKLCYYPMDDKLRAAGVSEQRPLAFHSPYGCSKGAAEQYVLDYAHAYGLNTTVFRMSCIYGPRQFGTEDQGWVAHFLIRALQKQPITLFGDGKQVRDILFIDDLVNALIVAHEQIDRTAGEAFNVGGGPMRAVSLLELLALIEQLLGEPVNYSFDEWRRGDQKYYVSDTSKLAQRTGWQPRVSVQEGLERLYSWLMTLHSPPMSHAASWAATQQNGSGQPLSHKREGEQIYGG